jgi:hypothetical protein
MSTQVIAAKRRIRLRVALGALALALAISVLAVQASAIWSGDARSRTRPVSAAVPAATSKIATSLPTFVHPHVRQGQVRSGPMSETSGGFLRPHTPNQRPKWGS